MTTVSVDDIFVDFGEICRLCLENSKDLIRLNSYPAETYKKAFDESLELKDLPLKLGSLTAIQVGIDDFFPTWICGECATKLNAASDFIAMCLRSQNTLEESFVTELLNLGVSRENVQDIIIQKGFKSPLPVVKKEINYPDDNFESVSDTYETANWPSCIDCSKEFKNENELSIHRISVHHDDLVDTGNSLTCDVCKVSLRSKAALSFHIKCHENTTQIKTNNANCQLTKCRYCGEEGWAGNFNAHLKTVHHVSKTFIVSSFDCQLCYRPFLRHSGLRNHIARFHHDQLEELADQVGCAVVWNCSVCKTFFDEESLVVTHYADAHGKRVIDPTSLRSLQPRIETCDCGYISSSPLEDCIHDVFFHPERIIENVCPACDALITGIPEFREHLVLYHMILSVGLGENCILCDASCESFDRVKTHLIQVHGLRFNRQVHSVEEIIHSEERDFINTMKSISVHEKFQMINTCGACNSSYGSQEELNSHSCDGGLVAFKTEISGRFQCPKCSKSFASKMNLHHHYKRKHLRAGKRYVCSFCGKTVKGLVALRSHEERLHCGLRRFPCPDCPRAFTTAGILRKHTELHMAVRPMHTCPFCNRLFSTSSGIARHVQTHQGIKRFVCQMEPCQKSFYTAAELHRHTRFHTKDLRHQCNLCRRKFFSPGELWRHFRTKHSSERRSSIEFNTCTSADSQE